MKVLLRTEVAGVGRRGDIVDVADGFARNRLLPSGWAVKAAPAVESQALAMRRNREKQELQAFKAAEAAAGKLVALTLEIPAKVGSGGRLFGSITASDIAAAVRDRVGIDVDRRKVVLDEPIKSLGTRQIVVHLHTDVTVEVAVEVVAEKS